MMPSGLQYILVMATEQWWVRVPVLVWTARNSSSLPWFVGAATALTLAVPLGYFEVGLGLLGAGLAVWAAFVARDATRDGQMIRATSERLLALEAVARLEPLDEALGFQRWSAISDYETGLPDDEVGSDRRRAAFEAVRDLTYNARSVAGLPHTRRLVRNLAPVKLSKTLADGSDPDWLDLNNREEFLRALREASDEVASELAAARRYLHPAYLETRPNSEL
jgi:hypothetical protein